MENQINYYKISRKEWSGFYKDHIAPLTEAELQKIKSLNASGKRLRCTLVPGP